MPIRFSTEAANADFLVDDNERASGGSQAIDAGRAAADRFSRGPGEREAPSGESAGKPGKDINAPGYLKDKDSNPS
jgi:hypothetical protein